jgi:integrase
MIYRDTVVPQSNTGRPKGQKSIQRYKAIINNFIEWFERSNAKAFSDIKPDIIAEFFNYMVDGLKRSASTISKHRQMLINFFDWAIAKGYTTGNPATAIKNPKREKKIPRYFTEEELRKIFAAAKPPYKNLFRFLYLTGLRIGEAGNLEWGDYDRGQKHIVLRVMEGNKTKREEIVPLHVSAIAILEEHKDVSPGRYIFTNSAGGKLKNSKIYSQLLSVTKKTGILNASPHTFRHTCASHLAIAGVSLYIIKDILRHASIKETEIYAHLSKDAVASAIERLSA